MAHDDDFPPRRPYEPGEGLTLPAPGADATADRTDDAPRPEPTEENHEDA
jgi:hypothetical protein